MLGPCAEGNGPSLVDIDGGNEIDIITMVLVGNAMTVGNGPSPDDGDP